MFFPAFSPWRWGLFFTYLLLAVTCLDRSSALAYEYGEHKDLGDEAFRAVKRRLVKDGLYPSAQALENFLKTDVNFLFAPSLGLQPGPLLGWDNYVLPDWLRIPLQIILPVKGCVTYNINSGGANEASFALEVDLVF